MEATLFKLQKTTFSVIVEIITGHYGHRMRDTLAAEMKRRIVLLFIHCVHACHYEHYVHVVEELIQFINRLDRISYVGRNRFSLAIYLFIY